MKTPIKWLLGTLAFIVVVGVVTFFILKSSDGEKNKNITSMPTNSVEQVMPDELFINDESVSSIPENLVIIYLKSIRDKDWQKRQSAIVKKTGSQKPEILTRLSEEYAQIELSPDRQTIVFSEGKKIKSLDVSKKIVKDIITLDDDLTNFIFSKDSKYILVSDFGNPRNIIKISLAENIKETLFSFSSEFFTESYLMGWPLENKVIYFNEAGDGVGVVSLLDTETKEIKRINDSEISMYRSRYLNDGLITQETYDETPIRETCSMERQDDLAMLDDYFRVVNSLTNKTVAEINPDKKIATYVTYSPGAEEILYTLSDVCTDNTTYHVYNLKSKTDREVENFAELLKNWNNGYIGVTNSDKISYLGKNLYNQVEGSSFDLIAQYFD